MAPTTRSDSARAKVQDLHLAMHEPERVDVKENESTKVTSSNHFDMKKLETELSNIKISASTSSTEKENPINMKDVMTELERTEASPPARSSDASVNLNKKPLDMKEIASELDQIKVTPPKGLSNMKDLNHEVNNIISALPEVTSGASHLYKHTLIAQKSAAAGCNRKRVANPPALSKQERESKLETITPSALNIEHKGKSSGVMAAVLLCKFIQCALWDAGFQYALLNYQFDAVLAAAGVDVRVLLDIFIKWNDLQRSVLVSQCDMGQKMRVDVCKDCVKFAKTRGLLVADAMGLGKTIEGVGAAMLRSYIYSIQKGDNEDALPTLIIVPNDAFMNQWESALIASGISPSRIWHFAREKECILKGELYIIMTRYSLMSEMRHALKDEGSALFPELPSDLVDFLQEKRSDGDQVDSVTLMLGRYSSFVAGAWRFRTLIIDECHSLRNLMTYGGIGAVILGINSDRVVPMSCTPFINSTQDLATIMAFIDPKMKSSYKTWWKQATKQNADYSIVEEVRRWRKYFLVGRQKEMLSHKLPEKTETVISVDCFESELHVYKRYEDSFVSTFESFKNSTDPGLTLGKKDLTNILLMYLINMRMTLIHPLIPKGREFTIRFSPSRRHLEAELSQSMCVCCADRSNKMICVPSNMCHAAKRQSPHYVHEHCLELLRCDDTARCPRCKDLETRTCMDSTVPRPVHCRNVQITPDICGFKATAKIQKIIEWVMSLPCNDKAVIYSFFEGSLDLIEGVLVDDLGIGCARLDNDCSQQDQATDLKRFKSSTECRILLATVQSCGSGLNIEEANHIAFLDRWFDASIHQQAIDRCHNLNQKKKVKVTYFDAAITVDEIMKAINDAMSTNASISLADGTTIGAQHRSIRYQDVSGPIYRMMKAVIHERNDYISTNPGSPLSSCREVLRHISESMDTNQKQNASVSPPSVLRTPSFGSGTKSNPDGVQRRVIFAPLPNDTCNSEQNVSRKHTSGNNSKHIIQSQQQLSYNSPSNFMDQQSVELNRQQNRISLPANLQSPYTTYIPQVMPYPNIDQNHYVQQSLNGPHTPLAGRGTYYPTQHLAQADRFQYAQYDSRHLYRFQTSGAPQNSANQSAFNRPKCRR